MECRVKPGEGITRLSFCGEKELFRETDRFKNAIAAADADNGLDPQTGQWHGRRGPRELLFAQCVYEWVNKLNPDASEPLLLAARTHTLCRWEVPRSEFEMNKPGYRKWRDACATHHAEVAEKLLKGQGYEDAIISQVLGLILKKNWPVDLQAQTLEDADCLAFLEMKLADYVDEWEPEKAVNILRKTLRKMTPQAHELAATIDLDPRAAELLQKAMQ
jgi:hypothetical protein